LIPYGRYCSPLGVAVVVVVVNVVVVFGKLHPHTVKYM